MIGYFTLKERLERVWKLVAGFANSDIENNNYMVKFDYKRDRVNLESYGG